jgi:hypothetical protein
MTALRYNRCDHHRRGARVADAAGLENRCEPAPNRNSPHDLEHTPESVLADCLALLAPVRPDLAAVVPAWPTLREHVRLAILALADTGGKR